MGAIQLMHMSDGY